MGGLFTQMAEECLCPPRHPPGPRRPPAPTDRVLRLFKHLDRPVHLKQEGWFHWGGGWGVGGRKAAHFDPAAAAQRPREALRWDPGSSFLPVPPRLLLWWGCRFSAPAVWDKASINCRPVQRAGGTKSPTRRPCPQTRPETNVTALAQKGIIRPMSVNTFTYLRALSAPPPLF